MKKIIHYIKDLFKSNVDLTVSSESQTTIVKDVSYHPKIILAWIQVLEGNQEIASWLMQNGYEELVYASSAIHLRKEARKWLMENGYPHLMAMVNASEGNQNALQWLKVNKMDILYHIALAVDNEQKAWAWLKHNTSEDIFLLAKSMNTIKNQIEERHNDIHTYGID